MRCSLKYITVKVSNVDDLSDAPRTVVLSLEDSRDEVAVICKDVVDRLRNVDSIGTVKLTGIAGQDCILSGGKTVVEYCER